MMDERKQIGEEVMMIEKGYKELQATKGEELVGVMVKKEHEYDSCSERDIGKN